MVTTRIMLLLIALFIVWSSVAIHSDPTTALVCELSDTDTVITLQTTHVVYLEHVNPTMPTGLSIFGQYLGAYIAVANDATQ